VAIWFTIQDGASKGPARSPLAQAPRQRRAAGGARRDDMLHNPVTMRDDGDDGSDEKHAKFFNRPLKG